MKKLGKLSINPEKVMKSNELVNLKGGYGTGSYDCYCYQTWENFQVDGVSLEELADIINAHCQYGGECTPC